MKQNLRVEATVVIPPGAEVQLTITYKPAGKKSTRSKVVALTGGSETSRKHLQFDLEKLPSSNLFSLLWMWLRTNWEKFSSLSIPPVFFLAAAVTVYYLVRLIRLTDFPIFFFTDEAIHTIQAIDLVHRNFTGPGNEFLPTFFKNGSMYNLGTSVYLQVLPALTGDRSAFLTRFVSTTITLLAAISIGLSFDIIRTNKRGWLAVMALSIIPAWFYHSRTAFETVEAVTFFAVFLYAYLRYRSGNFRWVYVAVTAAALTFYCYSPARVVMAAFAVVLLVSDFPFHWVNRKKLWIPILIGIVFCVPYFRFLILHPGENEHHLELLGSYWVKTGPVYEKILDFLKLYLNGLNPLYWFLPNQTDLSRHIMKGMGHLGWFFLPFFIGGLYLGLRKWKDPNYRIMLLALLVSPAGAAIAGIGITRALFMVIPAAFFIALGMDYSIDWVRKHLPAFKPVESLVLLLLALGNFILLDICLTDGPTWFSDYGMEGMQYGASQVFGHIKEIKQQNPNLHINLPPDWANGTDVLARFFLGDPVSIEMSGMNAFIGSFQPFPENTLFVMTPEDLSKVAISGKFEPVQVVDILFYPNGTPGFLFAHLKYNTSALQSFSIDQITRKSLVPDTAQINGITVEGATSKLDMGTLQQAFDNDPGTLIRSLEANPLVIEVKFQKSIPVKSITATIGGPATGVIVYAQPADGSRTYTSGITLIESNRIRQVQVPVKLGEDVSRLRFEIRTVRDSEPSHVHLWDIKVE
jgi:hypothetical protein